LSAWLTRQLNLAEADKRIIEDLRTAGSPMATVDVLVRLNVPGNAAEGLIGLEERPTLAGWMLPFVRAELEEHSGPLAVHGNDQVRQQVVECLGAGDKLGAVVDNPYGLDHSPESLSQADR
jgi:hypothetical protein